MNLDRAINITYQAVISPYTLTKWIFTRDKKPETNDDACPRFSEIPVEAETDKIDAAWPPAPHPVEALSVHDLFRANGKLIRDLCYATTLSEEESQRFLLPVITNLAAIVHLTPASEYDHHQGYGGLFTHSLEVAYYAANEAKTTIFDRSASPKELHQNKRRWILTAVLAALTHDIGKVFTDMNITATNGAHWVQDEPILTWLRKNRIEHYFISFRPGREHNAHKSASLANSAMLIPKETFTFLGLTGYGELMLKEYRNALLEGKEGGLVGRILDNADGLSRRVDQLRQRKIRPEFKNVAHPQGDMLLKAIRVLIQSARWTTNRDVGSRVFNTKQGCFIVWSEGVVEEIRSQALDMGFEALPSDLLRLATVLVDAGAAIRNTDEISNTHNVFWRITPIVLGNIQLDCIRLADPQLIFDATPPAAIEGIIEGLAVDEVTKEAWKKRWKFLPVQKLSQADEMAMGYTEDYINALALDAEERLREADALAAEVADLYGAPAGDQDFFATLGAEGAVSEEGIDSISEKETAEGFDPYGSDSSGTPDLSDELTPVDGERTLISEDEIALVKPQPKARRTAQGAPIREKASEPEEDVLHQPYQPYQSYDPGWMPGTIPNVGEETVETVAASRTAPDSDDEFGSVLPQTGKAGKRGATPHSSGHLTSEVMARVEAAVLPPDAVPEGLRETLAGRSTKTGDDVTVSVDAPQGEALTKSKGKKKPKSAKPRRSEEGFDMDALLGTGPAGMTKKGGKKDGRDLVGGRNALGHSDALGRSGDDGALAPFGPADDGTGGTLSDRYVDGDRVGDHETDRPDASAEGLGRGNSEVETQEAARRGALESDPYRTDESEGLSAAARCGLAADDEPEGFSPDVADDPDEIPDTLGLDGFENAEEDEDALYASYVETYGSEDSDSEVSEVPKGEGEASVAFSDSDPGSDPEQTPIVFFNEPLGEDGKPLLAKTGRGEANPSLGHLKPTAGSAEGALEAPEEAQAEVDAGKTAAAPQSAPLRTSVDRIYAEAEDMVESMTTQLEHGFGIWLSDGVTTDPTTGCWSTGSSAFERAVLESGIDSDLVEMAIDKRIERKTLPRIEWDRKARRILLIK